MSLLDVILGRPLPSSEERAEQIGPLKGIPIFGLDALGSAAYGPEAALTLLIPLGLAGLKFIAPLSIGIIVLLTIVYLSYRQTIAAYPSGGGSYIVAKENLGSFSGLLAASALLIDYALDAAVGISTGIGALTSAVPALHPHTLMLCLIALFILTVVNLRGVSETGAAFLIPTYLFLVCMAVTLGIGLTKALMSAGHPIAVIKPPVLQATAGFSVWLIVKAYAGGCTALTGVEAVSNGVGAFRENRIRNAQRTLFLIIFALGIMLAGIAYLVKCYGIMATDPNGNSYQSVLSMLFAAVMGRGWFYYLSIASVLVLLTLSANTAFADFPRVCRFVAEDGFLPTAFANRGRRLVYSDGIFVLTLLTAALLVGFGGITDRLIPLFAIGALLSFTMSQAGMVAHWRRVGGGASASLSLVLNLTGAIATGITVLIVIVAKFAEGAWITLIAIPLLLLLMYSVRRHYTKIRSELEIQAPLEPNLPQPPILVVTMQGWTRVNKAALRTAMSLSSYIHVVHVTEEKPNDFCEKWEDYVAAPARSAGLPIPQLVQLHSPYRLVVTPIVDYVKRLSEENPGRRIITVIPELVERRWFLWLLHTQRAEILKGRLLMEGNDRISVLNIAWYQKSR